MHSTIANKSWLVSHSTKTRTNVRRTIDSIGTISVTSSNPFRPPSSNINASLKFTPRGRRRNRHHPNAARHVPKDLFCSALPREEKENSPLRALAILISLCLNIFPSSQLNCLTSTLVTSSSGCFFCPSLLRKH